MNILLVLLFLCLLSYISFKVYKNYKDNKLIEQVTQLNRGEWSERRLILMLLKAGINPRAIFHDLYIQKANGEYTQIDVAVATKSGLIVFEVKDYSGWIFGNEEQKYWTQILAFGKEKHRFYNPIMQNAGHISALRECLTNNPNIPIFSVIVFFGNCELKKVTVTSDDTYVFYDNSIIDFIDFVMHCQDASFGDKHQILDVLTTGVNNGLDPNIVYSQKISATKYSQDKPQSTFYSYVWRYWRYWKF
ncbi:MAG: nuclease-related domain-containing protein [Bacteroidales bacterium]|nr:nuclease-related domain-containing protein [Bacteroidales bacterium]